MISRYSNRVLECVVVDMNTQTDFCTAAGAHPVANHETLIPALRRVVAWTRRNGVPVVSSLDSHRQRDINSVDQPPCCIDGSNGQTKVPFTILPCNTRVEVDNTLNIPLNLFSTHQQVLFRVRDDDLLANPKADRFLTQLPTKEFIVSGNVVEHSVKFLVLGLLARNKAVSVVVDACGYWNKHMSELSLRQMTTKGARLLSVCELLQRKLSRRRRYRQTITGNGNGRDRNGIQSDELSRSLHIHAEQLPSHPDGTRMSRKNGRGHPNGS